MEWKGLKTKKEIFTMWVEGGWRTVRPRACWAVSGGSVVHRRDRQRPYCRRILGRTRSFACFVLLCLLVRVCHAYRWAERRNAVQPRVRKMPVREMFTKLPANVVSSASIMLNMSSTSACFSVTWCTLSCSRVICSRVICSLDMRLCVHVLICSHAYMFRRMCSRAHAFTCLTRAYAYTP